MNCAGLHSQDFLRPRFKAGHCSNPGYCILLGGVSIHLNISCVRECFVCMYICAPHTHTQCLQKENSLKPLD